MKNTMKRVFAMLLCLAMIAAMLPTTILAEEATIVEEVIELPEEVLSEETTTEGDVSEGGEGTAEAEPAPEEETPAEEETVWTPGEDETLVMSAEDATALIDTSVLMQGQILSYNIPTDFMSGDVKTASVTVMNTGATTWTADKPDWMRLRIEATNYLTIWIDEAATASGAGDANRIPVTEEVATGDIYTYNFYVAAKSMVKDTSGSRTFPATDPGTYSVKFGILHEQSGDGSAETWLGELISLSATVKGEDTFAKEFNATTVKTTYAAAEDVEAVSGWAAAFLSAEMPTTVKAGEKFGVRFSMLNNGNDTYAPWYSGMASKRYISLDFGGAIGYSSGSDVVVNGKYDQPALADKFYAICANTLEVYEEAGQPVDAYNHGNGTNYLYSNMNGEKVPGVVTKTTSNLTMEGESLQLKPQVMQGETKVIKTVAAGQQFEYTGWLVAPYQPGTYTLTATVINPQGDSTIATDTKTFTIVVERDPDEVVVRTEEEAKAMIDESKTYYGTVLSYSLPETFNPGEVQTGTITVMNIGSATWNRNSYNMRLHVGSQGVTIWENAAATTSSVGDANMYKLAADVAPGETHTYSFYIAPKYLASKVDGVRTWADTGVGNYVANYRLICDTDPTWQMPVADGVSVTHSINGTAVVEDVTLDAVTAEPRTVRNATVTVKNNGTEAWTATATDATAVAAPSADGVYLKYTYNSWLSPFTSYTHTGYVPLTSDVAAGKSAEFAFSFTSPVQEGDFTLKTTVVSCTVKDVETEVETEVDGEVVTETVITKELDTETAISLQERTTYTTVTATAARAADAQTAEGNEADEQYAAEIVSAKVPTTVLPGSATFISFDVKNTGTADMGLAFFSDEPSDGYVGRGRVKMEQANRDEGFLLIDWGAGSGNANVTKEGTIETPAGTAIAANGNGGNDFTSLNMQAASDGSYVSPLGTAYSGDWRSLVAGKNRIFTGKLVAPEKEGEYEVTFYVRATNLKDVSDRYTFNIRVDDGEGCFGHNYNAVVTAPTFNAQGYTTYTCADCGDSYVDDYVDPIYTADAISTNEDSHGELTVSEDGKTVTLTAEGEVKCLEGTGTGITANWIGFKVTTPEDVDAADVTITRPDGVTRNLDAIKDGTDPVFANLYWGIGEEKVVSYLIDWNSDGVNDLTVVIDATNITVKHVYEETVTDPTCTEAGKTVYTCACGDSYEEEIAATGHTEETVPGTPATCTESGLTDGVVCSECSETITAQEEIPASGHTYVDGVCTECSAADPDAALTDAALKTTQQAISLQDYVGMQFVVLKKAVSSYDRAYAVVERADGTKTEMEASLTASYTRFEVPILAAEMSEKITFTLYGEKDGKTYKGESLTKSVSSLCGEKFSAANDATKKVIVDMLNYGAAVQTQFYPGEAELANANLTAAQLAYGAQSNPSTEGTLAESGSGTVAFQAKSLSLQEKVEFSLVLKLADASKADYEVRITQGGATTTIDGADLVKVNASYVRFNHAAAAINMREVYTIAVYEKATGTQVSKTLTMDIAGLANSKLGAGLDSVIYAMLNYGDAAAALVS